MPIDASIPLQVAVPRMNLAEIMLQAERYKGMKADRERAASDYERQQNARKTLADLILGQTPDAPGMVTAADYRQGPTNPLPSFMTPGINPEASVQPQDILRAEGMPNAKPNGPSPWEQYVRYDPQGALDLRATTQDWQGDQFKMARDLNEGVLQILGGVYDQASYERGKNKARALYGRHGVNLQDFQLPDEYSPELIRSLQMEAMDTRHQLDTVRRERKLEWDIEDDQLDNERMDRNTDSLIETREDRLAEYERNNRERSGIQRRGQDMNDRRGRRGQDMRDSRAATGSSSRASSRPTATDANGNKVEWNGKAWVPVK